ncbi:MAG: BTAD domain-containing putative transcriptional regulator [Acidimicrobiia bacterium]
MEPQILVLGPIAVRDATGLRPLGGDRTHRFLAALTISANHAVTIDRLVDVVWGDDPPGDPEGSVHTLASKVRHLLGPDALLLEDHSYRLVIDPLQVDACRFERLVDRAQCTGTDDPDATIRGARDGLGLWRGPAYGGLADVDPFRIEAIRLEELRVSLAELLVDAQLATGNTTWAIPMVRSMISESPYREHLWAMLIRALGSAGRRREAATVYADYAATMAGIGLDPDPAIGAELARALACDR